MKENMNYSEGKAIVMHAFDRLHVTTIKDNSVFLYLLHFCRHKLFVDSQSDSFRKEYCYGHIEKVLQDGNVENNEILRELTKVFNEELLMLNNTGGSAFSDIVCPLMDISAEWYNNYYTSVFEELLLQIASGQHLNLFIQPTEITKLISKLSGYTQNGIVYNPFAGAASYAVEMNTVSAYIGQEVNERIWAIGTLRLLANSIKTDNYVCQDSLNYWRAKFNDKDYVKPTFDIIVSSPPFGAPVDIEALWNEPFKIKCNVEDFLIARGIEGLTPKGKLIGLFSAGVLFNGGATEVERKYAVDNDYLETVISLPSNLYSNTSISSVIIIFCKNKKLHQNVKFVDGSSFFKKVGRLNILDFEQILHVIDNLDNEYVRTISTKAIIENDYILSVGRYFSDNVKDIQIPAGYKLVKLSDLATIYRSEKSEGSFGKIIRIGDLASDPFKYQKKFSEFETGEVTTGFQKISSNVLLLSKIRSLKPTYCIVDEVDSVYCSNNIISLEVDNLKIDIDYLICELNSRRVEKYVTSKYAAGVNIPSIRLKDLLEIPILLPPIDQQKKIVDLALKKYQEEKIAELGFEIGVLKDSRREAYEKNMHLRKHALEQVMNSFSPAFSLLKMRLDKNDGVLKSTDIVAFKTNETVKDYFEKMNKIVAKLENMINSLVDDQEFGESETIYIEKFLEDYRKKHIDPGFKVVFPHQLQKVASDYSFPGGLIKYPDGTEEFIEEMNISAGDESYSFAIKICPKDLEQILDNLVSNAKSHGFTDLERNDYEVKLSLKEDAENSRIIICVANNGNALPKGMDRDKFFKWGVGSHTGLGTWQVKNITEHFDGVASLMEYRNDPFPIEIQLSFPLTNRF